MTKCIYKLRNFLQSDRGDCSWIAEIAVGLLRLQSDCGDCSWIVEIAVGLLRLQLNCGDCSLKHCAGCLTHSGMWTPRGKSR